MVQKGVLLFFLLLSVRVTLCSVLWWCRIKMSVSFERWLSSWMLDCHYAFEVSMLAQSAWS